VITAKRKNNFRTAQPPLSEPKLGSPTQRGERPRLAGAR
jgi:hypothetical protein